MRIRAELRAALAGEFDWRELVATLARIVWITRLDSYRVYVSQQ